MLSYLAGNWKQLAGVAIAAAALGYVLHRPAQPAVKLKEQDHADTTATAAAQQHKDEAPTRVTDRRFAPACAGAPPVVVREVVTERGRVVTDTAMTKVEHQVEDRKLDLTVTPAPRPGWQLQVGTEDLLSLNGAKMVKELRLAGRRRLFGPTWGEVSTKPLHRCERDDRWCPTVGAALGVEF